MKCSEIQDVFGTYWDLPEDDHQKILVNEHLKTCASCSEEFEFWRESNDLIQVSALVTDRPVHYVHLTQNVMDRIYSDEGWKLPVSSRAYSISSKLRRNASTALAFCLTFFAISFIYSIVSESNSDDAQAFIDASGLLPAATALGDGADLIGNSNFFQEMPVASISDPLVLKMGPITYPDYLVAVSLLGLISVLLFINWFSRTRT
jgi:hypothetical protein